MKKLFLILGLLLATAFCSFSQTPDLIGASVNEEGAITLRWISQTNANYQIQCADELLDQGTVWRMLYNNYPSHGSNTFWSDTGNYHYYPPILHPKYSAKRFYRIVAEEADTATNKPTVSIVFPTNGLVASDSLTVTVVATTPMATLETKFYVDGQEMWPSPDGSNYVINTCEWANGPHVLFATAESLSSFSGGGLDQPAVKFSHAVSPLVSIVFSNLVTLISFSEPFFEPSLGQTQQVSAVFAANADWTLEIKDISSNVVRTATGSGASMRFYWDGKDDGGTNVPVGIYHYYITAQTNGLVASESPGDGGGGSPPTLNSFAAGSETVGLDFSLPPLPPLPPGLAYSEEQLKEISMMNQQGAFQQISRQNFFLQSEESSMGLDEFSGPVLQVAPPAPEKPPTAPISGTQGTFGVAYQTYTANGETGFTPARPRAVPGVNSFITFEGKGSIAPNFRPLKNADTVALKFDDGMSRRGWKNRLFRGNDDLKIADLRGTGNPFNNVNVGLLNLHCVYGDKLDLTVGGNGCFQMYFPIASGTSSEYLRMSEMKFGGADTNGLKWMALFGCHTLYHVNWNSMQNAGVKPYNSNLRLLLGTDTNVAIEPSVGALWAQYMIKGDGTTSGPMQIKTAWYKAGIEAYRIGVRSADYSNLIPMIFAVAGDSASMADYLQSTNNAALSGTWTYNSQQVYPPPP